MSRTNLSAITSDLLASGAIAVADTDAAYRTGSGRPAELLTLDPKAGQFLGIDFGHRRVHLALADASHEVIATGRAEYPDGADWDERVAVALALIDDISRDSDVHYGALHAVGIGVPGFGTAPFGRAHEAEHLPVGFSVAQVFQERFDAAVILDNNTRFAALAEAVHARDGGIEDLVYLRLSDGIGGGVIVGGRLVAGAAGMAAELGHVLAADGGSLCRCGRHGCLETVASVPAILARCAERGVEVGSLDDLSIRVKRRHPVVEDVLRTAGAAVGRVLSAAATILNPAQIIIGGEITRVAPLLVAAAADQVSFDFRSAGIEPPAVQPAELGDEAGSYGAIAALFHRSPLLAGYSEAHAAPDSLATRRRIS